MKRLIHWCRENNRRYFEKHPEMRKARRMIARYNGLLVILFGLAVVYTVVFENPAPASLWQTVLAVLGGLATSALGFASFIWSFRMRDKDLPCDDVSS